MNRNSNNSQMNIVKTQAEQQNMQAGGLFLCGTIVDRTRRHVPKENPTTEIVTYILNGSNEKKYYVDDYAPDHYFNLGTYVTLPVYVKPYQKKNNDMSYNLCVQKESSSRGEHF